MTPFKTELETQLRNLMKTASQFDDLVALARGILYLVPTEWYPLAEIVVDSEAEDTESLGPSGLTAVHGYAYDGAIYFTDQYPDHPTLSNREVDVTSQDRVAVWAQALVLLLRGDQTLTDLESADGKEKVWRVDVRVPKYAIAPSRGRADNLESQAAVEFTVHTMRRTY
jgi:hypothetical protein